MRFTDCTILTPNLQPTKQFYAEKLGFPVVRSTKSDLKLQVGRSCLTFVQTDQHEAQYHFAFEIPNNLVDEAVTWCAGKVELIIPEDEESAVVDLDNWQAKSLYFYDNNKNLVELIARKPNGIIAEGPFNASKIVCLSEMGIAAGEPLTCAEEIHAALHIPYFARGPQRENFVAMGDDDGLLLISQSDRVWFPSHDVLSREVFVQFTATDPDLRDVTFSKK